MYSLVCPSLKICFEVTKNRKLLQEFFCLFHLPCHSGIFRIYLSFLSQSCNSDLTLCLQSSVKLLHFGFFRQQKLPAFTISPLCDRAMGYDADANRVTSTEFLRKYCLATERLNSTFHRTFSFKAHVYLSADAAGSCLPQIQVKKPVLIPSKSTL